MLNKALNTLIWGSQMVDLAVETRATVVRETRAAAISLVALGFAGGAAAVDVGGFACLSLHTGVRADSLAAGAAIVLGAGVLVAGFAAVRLKRATDRLNAVKDLLTAKAARDAASQLASSGVELALKGVAAAQDLAGVASSVARRFMPRTSDAPMAADTPSPASHTAKD